MDRRRFLEVLAAGAGLGLATAGGLACDSGPGDVLDPGGGAGPGPHTEPADDGEGGAQEPTVDASQPAEDAAAADADVATVIMYDTYAIALYYDGTHGPRTGVIRVAYLLADVDVTLDFWHGHGFPEQLHAYTVTPAHFAELKAGKRVTVETSYVEDHNHTLFIDPVDPQYRVPGAVPTPVPV